ncbi:uncharacterized protein GGS22DRAFT_163856 [Annulohypoxylon maeteangense]|uniref:uncharacterized protein n=1 Tax=Annulohypoxylon maeteangense TaxID=1927788 RepID=UPI0020088D25|nr:uncharacterized protein GGS22DRAFT_163856 [Annulohypoxylon maeteangense]KAI0884594.1 hypothetical protein GGS22DRAFT_163856 [Annulohypoxylon maeteangense]
MSASSQSSTSPGGVDPLDLLDFSEYDAAMQYRSPSASPTANKQQFARASAMVNTPTTMPQPQPLSGPSHQYDQYKQQTPFVPGALASTLAIQNANQVPGYTLDYMSSEMNANDEMFDFNSAPSQNMNSAEMDMDFESQNDASFYFPEQTVNPNAIGGESQMTSPTVPSQTSNVGRMYPGMHQQAALAKAQAQQRQQQHLIQQQQQQRQNQAKQHRAKAPMPSDPIVEQKITQLLNSMRSKAGASPSDGENSPLMQLPRTKKEEDDMDEDERLLASEEGKKLSSKERRQLRNKVSARAFRSRRKEYITQLESEIANKVTENGDLRAQNRALMEENRRLSDLTRMLLSSPSFSNFLDHLSSNPSAPQQQAQPEQRQPEPRQVPKDVNPYTAGQQTHQHQQIGMVMMPEQTMDFSMLNINSDAFNYQPQVFAVLETPEMPVIDTEALTGKTSNFVGECFASDAEKTDAPIFEAPIMPSTKAPEPLEAAAEPEVSERAVANLDGDIYDDDTTVAPSKPTELDTDSLIAVDIFGGVESEKTLALLEVVGSSEEDVTASIAAKRVERLAANLETVFARLSLLATDL